MNSSATLSTSLSVIVSTATVMVLGRSWQLSLSSFIAQYVVKLSNASKKVANFLWELLDMPFIAKRPYPTSRKYRAGCPHTPPRKVLLGSDIRHQILMSNGNEQIEQPETSLSTDASSVLH